jgi:2'-5' RNA ligase
MDQRKLYCAVKIGRAHEETVVEYLDSFKERGLFFRLETVEPKRLHVTTAFLGEMPQAQAEAVLKASEGLAPFDCFLGEAMSFGSKVLILRAYGSGLLRLNRMHADSFEIATGRKLSGGQKYVPHLTLAKHDGAGSWNDVNAGVAALQNTPMMPFTVSSVGLYHKADLVAEVKLEGAPELAFNAF